MVYDLLLLRHGESEWNRKNLFTGWYDAELSAKGLAEAEAVAPALAESGLLPSVVHTSLQTRAIRTAAIAMDGLGRSWVPVRRSWRLNERHYGDLTGKDKKQTAAEHGVEQVKVWRRSYDTRPPPIGPDNEYRVADDPRYAHLAPDHASKKGALMPAF